MTDITERVAMERARDEFMAGARPRSAQSTRVDAARCRGAATAHPRTAVSVDIVDDIRSSSKRMSALVRDLMDLARGRLGGGIPVARRRCDFARICEADRRRSEARASTADDRHRGRWATVAVTGIPRDSISSCRICSVTRSRMAPDPIQMTLVGDRNDVLLLIANRGPVDPTGDALDAVSTVLGRAQDGKKLVEQRRDRIWPCSSSARSFVLTKARSTSTSEAGLTSFTVRLPRAAR